MIAKKDNKEYTINSENKAGFLAEGYDICDDNGKIIEYSPKKTVPYNDYIKIKNENENLKKELASLKEKKKVSEAPKDEVSKAEEPKKDEAKLDKK